MKILYVGESWLGSCARTLREGLARHPQVSLDEVNEDAFLPKHRAKWLRGLHRLLGTFYRKELYQQVIRRVVATRPDIVMVYKGHPIRTEFVRELQAQGLLTVNIYPDCSPHAHGKAHREAVGQYDLVISSKPFHCAAWRKVYGYENDCVFVPQGYDPSLHLAESPATEPPIDVSLVATWRPEYGDLMEKLAVHFAERGMRPRVAIGGHGWLERRARFPFEWVFGGELLGRGYVDWLRKSKICIAPVTREVSIGGVRQPGDEDTTRTYELAAAYCFFIHRRTAFAKTLYREDEEVPMFDDAGELATKIAHFLSHPEERSRMAARSHQRAVPAYSIDSRADAIVAILRERLDRMRG
jgi:spore maturation protein CgeB